MEELYRRADRYSTLEDNICAATQTVMIISKPAGNSKQEGKKPLEPCEGQGKNRKRPRDQPQKKREPPQFTPLNITYKRLVPLIFDLPDFKWPALIQTNPSHRNMSIRCNYHRDQGHETNRCRSLKFLVERLIKAGHLRRYIREVDIEEELTPTVGRITTDVAALLESRLAINYIPGVEEAPLDDQYKSK